MSIFSLVTLLSVGSTFFLNLAVYLKLETRAQGFNTDPAFIHVREQMKGPM